MGHSPTKMTSTLRTIFASILALAVTSCVGLPRIGARGLTSIETGRTISKVRAARIDGRSVVIGSSYEGTVLAITHDGRELWRNPLSGFMNRDLWCADITGDGDDEILAANADGSLYCLDRLGRLLWTFNTSDAPLNAVCSVSRRGVPYVVCGGYDMNIHYLNAEGQRLKTIASKTYSVAQPWTGHLKGSKKKLPQAGLHIANFLRPVRVAGGKQALFVHGAHNSNSGSGEIYLFEPLADRPFNVIDTLKCRKAIGDVAISDLDGDGIDEVTLGTSYTISSSVAIRVDLKDYTQRLLELSKLRKRIDGNGYRVAQTVSYDDAEAGERRCLTAFGSRLILSEPHFDLEKLEFLTNGYSYNDLWRDPHTGRILLGSAQSGGSCVHVIDPSVPGWKNDFTDMKPKGKLKAMLDNTAIARQQLKRFVRPAHERAPKPVYFMSESLKGDVEKLAMELEATCGSPIFLNGKWMPKVENWDRSTMASELYRKKRDRRREYVLSQEEALDMIRPLYSTDRKGVAFWGGHGNDPHFYSLNTMRKIMDGAKGKKSVFIYPELEGYSDDFAMVLRDHIYPIAEYGQDRNTQLYVRTKHAFWQAIVYLPLWSRLLSGEFADVFVPSMEETTDKTMEQSIAGRMGIWASGATNQWGTRCARDNPSFDRLRQHSHQMLPNHFLRTQVYNIACGATYQNNYPVDQEYFSILYELIAKGALYVPVRREIVSFSPVHLSMTEPDKDYLDSGNNVKWLTFFNQEEEDANPLVFNRLNGTWPGAPNTEWDFSRYAAGVKDRRLNYLPPYEHGLVMITPPQHGTFADPDAPRGKLADHLHPLYRNILKEYISDGRKYFSADGSETFAANTYHETIKTDIEAGAAKLPLTVSGGVAWVCAQTAPKHLRLTLIDSGYINPSAKTAEISLHTVKPVRMTDVLSGETLSGRAIDVPLGLFRFVDIEFEGGLAGNAAPRVKENP